MSLDGILHSLQVLQRGMEMTKKEFLVQEDSKVLQDFVKTNSNQLSSLVKDSKTAQVGAHSQSESNFLPTSTTKCHKVYMASLATPNLT